MKMWMKEIIYQWKEINEKKYKYIMKKKNIISKINEENENKCRI